MTYNLQLSYPNVSALTTSDKAIAVLYGRVADGTLVPILVDAVGAIKTSTANILSFDSNPSHGGASFEVMTVTGLLATDSILAVSQVIPGSNNAYVTGFSGQANNSLTVQWNTDPGSGAVIRVVVSR